MRRRTEDGEWRTENLFLKSSVALNGLHTLFGLSRKTETENVGRKTGDGEYLRRFAPLN